MNMEALRDKIEHLTKEHHIELAHHLIEHYHVEYDENSNGIFINMANLSSPALEFIIDFVKKV